jgi:hypothetical protein
LSYFSRNDGIIVASMVACREGYLGWRGERSRLVNYQPAAARVRSWGKLGHTAVGPMVKVHPLL